MKVLGIIAEYNPFHLGHKYHLEKSKQITGSNYTIVIMSGSFVQRGEPSFIDKWTKAKMAINNGADLVIELPFIFSVQSAEFFASGAINLLNNLNVVNYIAFGYELGQLDDFKKITEILIKEPPLFKHSLKKHLDQGYSFPVARSNALKNFLQHYKNEIVISEDPVSILRMSNNILAIEYLKALKLSNSNIIPVAIKRKGSLYKDENLNNNLASATGIRNSILKSGVNSIKKHVPDETFKYLIQYINEYQQFNTLNNYNQIINYLLHMNGITRLKNIMNIEPGLENRIITKSTECKDIKCLIQAISTKRYPKTRIQRILIHLMANLTKPLFYELLPKHPAYIRVLASNNKGFELLNKIKENCNLPIITKFSNYKQYRDTSLNKIISLDKISTDLYFIGLNSTRPFINMDYYMTPYIMKTYN